MGKIIHTTAGRKLTQAEYEASDSHQIENGEGDIVRSVDYVIAASDASDTWKSQADILCDGVADDEDINAALGAGAKVQLSPGTFKTNAPPTPNGNIFIGCGLATIIQPQVEMDSSMTISGYQARVQDMKIDGNSKAGEVSCLGTSPHLLNVQSRNHLIYNLNISAGADTHVNHCAFYGFPVKTTRGHVVFDGATYFNGDGNNCLIVDGAAIDIIGCGFETYSEYAIALAQNQNTYGFAIIGNYFETSYASSLKTIILGKSGKGAAIGGWLVGNYEVVYGGTQTCSVEVNPCRDIVIDKSNRWNSSIVVNMGSEIRSLKASNLNGVTFNTITVKDLDVQYLGAQQGRSVFYSDAAPTTGTWINGDTCYNISPAAGEAMGWIYVSGSWLEMPPLSLY